MYFSIIKCIHSNAFTRQALQISHIPIDSLSKPIEESCQRAPLICTICMKFGFKKKVRHF